MDKGVTPFKRPALTEHDKQTLLKNERINKRRGQHLFEYSYDPTDPAYVFVYCATWGKFGKAQFCLLSKITEEGIIG